MRHVKPYPQDERSLIDIGEEFLGSLPWWAQAKSTMDPTVRLHMDFRGKRTAEAHFDVSRSTPKRIVIMMGHEPESDKDKSSLAHEITHAVQWLTDSFGDLMYITDATRDLSVLSSTPIWEKLLYAIYISCPQETQAWEAGALYYHEPILDDMLPWMKSFNPASASNNLGKIQPKPNIWGIESFSELPAFWSEAYNSYGEIKPDSGIPAMRNLSLEEFLSGYSLLFKKTVQILS